MKYHNVVLIIVYFFTVKIVAVPDNSDNKCETASTIMKNGINEIIRMDDETLNAHVDAIRAFPLKIYKHSTLLDVDSAMLNFIASSDSLFEIFISELDKLPLDDEVTSLLMEKEGLLECELLAFPETLFKFFSKQQRLFLERYGKKVFYISDSIFYAECPLSFNCSPPICGVNIKEYLSVENENFINPRICVTPVIADACSLHFSSEKSKGDEQIILVNGTAYHIAKRKDGSTVIRKIDKDSQVQIGSCDG